MCALLLVCIYARWCTGAMPWVGERLNNVGEESTSERARDKGISRRLPYAVRELAGPDLMDTMLLVKMNNTEQTCRKIKNKLEK